jgi:hypothetical protein
MVNIYEIIQTLVPEYKLNKTPLKKQSLIIKQIEKINFTNFESIGTFANLFSCLLYQHENVDINLSGTYNILDIDYYNMELAKLKQFIEKYEFNPLINTKKILNLINQNIINNEIILFLVGYFNINIFIYSFETKLLKIYYLEDKLISDKESIVLVNKKDILTPNIGFQTLNEKKKLKYTDELIQNLCEDIYTIAIGLKENKKLEIACENDIKDLLDDKLFIVGIKEIEFIIDDNIFNSIDINNYLEDDKEANNYDPLEFKINLKEIYKKYYKENLMKDISKYY